MKRRYFCAVLAAYVFGSAAFAADRQPVPMVDVGPPVSPVSSVETAEPTFLDNYPAALGRAVSARKRLLIFFHGEPMSAAERAFQTQTVQDARIRPLLADYVLLKLSRRAEVEVDGKPVSLLKHASFKHMEGLGGVAIVDFRDPDSEHYGYAVSCLPFSRSRYYVSSFHGVKSIQTLLSLPEGNIEQRTMIWAVRMHPERPASTSGRFHPVLTRAAASHSLHQARLRVQGHHNWNSRFHQIAHRLGGGSPVEVCAESWPGQPLVEAALDCVHCWRQSSGHWKAVRGTHRLFGYDIRRGANGVWYATGIFSN